LASIEMHHEIKDIDFQNEKQDSFKSNKKSIKKKFSVFYFSLK
jgi:hypothetical protein